MGLSEETKLVAIRLRTKADLDVAKDRATYDEVLRAFLRMMDPEVVRDRLAGERDALARVVEARRMRRPLRRSAEKQILTARAARARWERWLAEGRARQTGPRRITWSPPAPGGGTRPTRPRRRGAP